MNQVNQKSQIASEKRKGFCSVGDALRNQTSKQIRAKGFWDMSLLAGWSENLGTDLAQKIQPVSIRRNGKGGGTLTIQTPSAYASEIAMRHDEICLRLNSALGYEAISKLHIRHVSALEDVKFKPSDKNETRQDFHISEQSPYSIKLENHKDLERALNALSEEFSRKKQKGINI